MTGGAAVSPEDYVRWCRSRLGAVTDRREHDLIVELAQPVADRKVLDVGCGDGALMQALSAIGARVTGIDPNPAVADPSLKDVRAALGFVDFVVLEENAYAVIPEMEEKARRRAYPEIV